MSIFMLYKMYHTCPDLHTRENVDNYGWSLNKIIFHDFFY